MNRRSNFPVKVTSKRNPSQSISMVHLRPKRWMVIVGRKRDPTTNPA